MAALPQVNPAGGPNPNSAPNPQQGYQMSVFDLPTVDTVLTGGARAAAQANMRQQSGAALAPPVAYQPPGAGPGMSVPAVTLPSYDPAAPSLVQTPANGVMGQGTGLTNALDARGAQGTFDDRMSGLRSTAPDTMASIGNWLFNPASSPAAQAHAAKSYAGGVYARPEAEAYFGAHPSLLAHAEKDPVGFATKLGPILDAAVAAQSGAATQGVVAHQTPDGTMVKPDENVEHTNAVAKGFGVSVGHAHAMTQPHHYTRDEFVSATEGLSRGALRNMWEMQHYLNPQQQALSTALTIAQQQAQAGGVNSPAAREYQRQLQIVGGIAPNINEISPAPVVP